MTDQDYLEKGFEVKEGVLYTYKGNEKNLIVPEGIKEIAVMQLFGGERFGENLESITFPSTLKKIGKWAFEGCKNLKSVQLNDGLQEIGNHAFGGCFNLENILFPDSVLEVGKVAFISCVKIKTIKLPKNLKTISNYLFSHCISLQSVTIPENVISIGKAPFSGCNELKEIVIPKSVKSICDGALSYPGMKITLECSGFIQRGDYIIDTNSRLIAYTGISEKAKIPEGVKSIGADVFVDDKLCYVDIPDSVIEIHPDAFRNFENLDFSVQEKIKSI